MNIAVDGHPQRYTGAYVTEAFLRILGTAPTMGRDFTAADNQLNAAKVAIIGHALWQRDFGGASDIIGKGFRLNGKAATVIGVMPKGFAFPTNEELWIPLFSEFPPRERNDPAANNAALRQNTGYTQRFSPSVRRFYHDVSDVLCETCCAVLGACVEVALTAYLLAEAADPGAGPG